MAMNKGASPAKNVVNNDGRDGLPELGGAKQFNAAANTRIKRVGEHEQADRIGFE
jgi:hypothetical protein